MSATISNVASHAGTSVATVSRYINGTGRVSKALSKAIEKAIRDLDYSPQRKRFQRSTKTIGLIFPDLDNLYYIPVIKGLELRLAEYGFSLLICSSEEDIKKEKRIISNLTQRGVDGIVLLGTRPISGNNQHIIALSEVMPTLTINDQILGSSVHSLIVDEAEGAYAAVNYLIGLGHRLIALINGYMNYTTYRYKYIGYEKALHDNDIPIVADYHIIQDPHELGGYKGALNLFQQKSPPTAIFSANDQIAIGVMKAAHEQRIRIPEDLSVIGFSNTPISTAVYPELTTVNQFPYKTGLKAADVIVKLIQNKTNEQQLQTIGTELVLRDSCGSPRA
ncbi:MAG: hypothetical protein DRP70_02885 [Spirochaetes bacterium]|nr:MAG: hypothetical protein DRP70_02885 [Spirochaetota bacterium]RKX98827.1 MAG: hypothetical protein DRZ90_01450 [Spirochaetota bacterium]